MREVELCIDGVPKETLPPEERGLIVGKIVNQHDVERPDFSIKHGDDLQHLSNIKFEFNRVVDWEEWGPICIKRFEYSSKLPIIHLPELRPHKGRMAVVGAGPSVVHYLDRIKRFALDEQDNLMTVNGAHDWLIRRGVIPRIHVISEIDSGDVEVHLGGPPHKDVIYYLASSCHEGTFKRLEGYKRVLFHTCMPMQGYHEAVDRFFPQEFMVASGFATFFKTVAIATVLGFRDFELFGIDSSFEGTSHVDSYAMADKEDKISVWAGDQWGHRLRKFTTQGGLAYQAKEFLEFCKYNQSGLRLYIHGDGLLRYLHENRYPSQYQELKG